MLEAGVYQLLRDDPGVKALIAGRIYGGRLPKDPTNPSVVYNVVVTGDVYSVAGATGFRNKRIQFDSYASEYTDSVKTSDAIRSVLKSFKGVLPDGTFVNGCIVVRDMDFPYEPGTTGYVFRRLLEVDFWYQDQ